MKEKMKAISTVIGSIAIVLILLQSCTDQKKEAAAEQVTSSAQYTCPMHHEILEDHPGTCPICGMTLIKKFGQASEKAGIDLNTVLQSVNSNVIANVNTIVPLAKEIPTHITAKGYLDFDSRTFNNISARFSGRIEKLYIKYAFQEIHIGQRIFDIYSPEMVTAQQDFIFLAKNPAADPELLNAAKQKLLLNGMTGEQVKYLQTSGKPFYSLPVYSDFEGHVHDVAHSQIPGSANTEPTGNVTDNIPLAIQQGMYVTKGQVLFNVVDPHRLWAIIKIDRSAMKSLKLNQLVKIYFPDAPAQPLNAKVDFIEPVLRDGDKTLSIRVYLHNMDHRLKVNSQFDAEIETGKINGFWIPRSAVVDLGKTKIVWLKNGASFKAKQVVAGAINEQEVQITAGLSLRDSIAANAQYLTDSESFIKTKSNE